MEHTGNIVEEVAARLAGVALAAALALAAAGCGGTGASTGEEMAGQAQSHAIAQATARLYAQDETAGIDVMTLDSMPSVPYVRAEDFLGDIFVGDFGSQA